MSKAIPISEIVEKASIRVTAKQIHKWIQRNLGLIYKRINGRIYIRLDDFERFLTERTAK